MSSATAGGLGTRPAARRGAALVGAVVLGLQLFYWLPIAWRRDDTSSLDFIVYYATARAVAAREPLYEGCRHHDVRRPPGCYLYPPPFAALLMPLGGLGARAFQRVWYAIVLAAFWAYAAGLVSIACRRVTLERVLIAGAVVQLVPGTTLTMGAGNADLVVWALCAFGLGTSRVTPALGCAAALKVYPAWALPAALAAIERGRLRAAATSAAVLGLVLGLSLLVVGAAPFADWLREAVPVLSEGTFTEGNVSIPMGVLRLLRATGLWTLQGGSLPGAARVFLVAAQAAAVVAVTVRTRRLRAPLPGAAALVTAALFAPLCWWDYAPLLLVLAAAWLRARREGAAPTGVGRGAAS
jgi:hypothetical protein